jgi:hypothetical protein
MISCLRSKVAVVFHAPTDPGLLLALKQRRVSWFGPDALFKT